MTHANTHQLLGESVVLSPFCGARRSRLNTQRSRSRIRRRSAGAVLVFFFLVRTFHQPSFPTVVFLPFSMKKNVSVLLHCHFVFSSPFEQNPHHSRLWFERVSVCENSLLVFTPSTPSAPWLRILPTPFLPPSPLTSLPLSSSPCLNPCPHRSSYSFSRQIPQFHQREQRSASRRVARYSKRRPSCLCCEFWGSSVVCWCIVFCGSWARPWKASMESTRIEVRRRKTFPWLEVFAGSCPLVLWPQARSAGGSLRVLCAWFRGYVVRGTEALAVHIADTELSECVRELFDRGVAWLEGSRSSVFSRWCQQQTPGAAVDATCAYFKSVDGGGEGHLSWSDFPRGVVVLAKGPRAAFLRGDTAKGTCSVAYETLEAVFLS